MSVAASEGSYLHGVEQLFVVHDTVCPMALPELPHWPMHTLMSENC